MHRISLKVCGVCVVGSGDGRGGGGCQVEQIFLREAFQLKNVTKSGKSPKGGGSAKNIKKS